MPCHISGLRMHCSLCWGTVAAGAAQQGRAGAGAVEDLPQGRPHQADMDAGGRPDHRQGQAPLHWLAQAVLLNAGCWWHGYCDSPCAAARRVNTRWDLLREDEDLAPALRDWTSDDMSVRRRDVPAANAPMLHEAGWRRVGERHAPACSAELSKRSLSCMLCRCCHAYRPGNGLQVTSLSCADDVEGPEEACAIGHGPAAAAPARRDVPIPGRPMIKVKDGWAAVTLDMAHMQRAVAQPDEADPPYFGTCAAASLSPAPPVGKRPSQPATQPCVRSAKILTHETSSSQAISVARRVTRSGHARTSADTCLVLAQL